MNKHQKLAFYSAIASAMALFSSAAHAQAAPVVAAISSLGQTIVSTVMNNLTQGVMIPFMTRATAQVQGEISKSTAAQIQATAAIAQHRISYDMKRDAAEIKERAAIPQDSCKFISNAEALKTATASANQFVTANSTRFTTSLSLPPDRAQFIQDIRQRSLDNYATPAEQKRLGAKPSDLPGADVDGAYLFGTPSGGLTYNEKQQEALKIQMARKTMLSMPDPLRNPEAEKGGLGALFEEKRKRLASFYSNANVGYLTIMSKYSPDPSTGKSPMEITNEMINGRFSHQNIAANLSRQAPGAILKDIAMMDSMRLWIDYQSLRNQERMLALLADQQIIAAESLANDLNNLRSSITTR